MLTVTATSGLTYAQLLSIRKNFMDNDVGNDVEETFVMGIAASIDFDATDGRVAAAYKAQSGLTAAVTDIMASAGGPASTITHVDYVLAVDITFPNSASATTMATAAARNGGDIPPLTLALGLVERTFRAIEATEGKLGAGTRLQGTEIGRASCRERVSSPV